MRSINTLDWRTEQQSPSFNYTIITRLFKRTAQVLLYVPHQFNNYLNSLDAAPDSYRKQVVHRNHENLQLARHQHIPSRVWHRRSALITMLQEQ